MLDKYFIKNLTKKGRILYYAIQIGLDLVWIIYLLNFAHLSRNEVMVPLVIGALVSLFISAAICNYFWRKPKEELESKEPEATTGEDKE